MLIDTCYMLLLWANFIITDYVFLAKSFLVNCLCVLFCFGFFYNKPTEPISNFSLFSLINNIQKLKGLKGQPDFHL